MNSRIVASCGRWPADLFSSACKWMQDCHPRAVNAKPNMLMIQRSGDERVVFSLSGRIEMRDVAELQRLFGLEAAGQDIALDLDEVTLIDREVVGFLARCDAENRKLVNCPAYIREWIDAERSRRRQH